jgi:choline-glycine betaine transporter
VLVMVLVAIFFVSGADAASVVLGTLSQRGRRHPQAWSVIFWGAATGAVAVVMLLVGGRRALDGLQTLTIIAAAPFALLMIVLCVALARDLRTDPMIVADRAIERRLREQHSISIGSR